MIIRRFPFKVAYRIAVLYRAFPPVMISAAVKDRLGRDYSESGADIAFALRADSIDVVTPVRFPDPLRPHDWVFPDTPQGIAAARDAGANLLWANTLMSDGHPIECVMRELGIVGELPTFMNRVIDRFSTNAMLGRNGFPVPLSLRVCRIERKGGIGLDHLRPYHLTKARLTFPIVIKLANRGSGFKACVVGDFNHLFEVLSMLLSRVRSEETIMLEQFLPGEEIVVITLPQHNASESYINTTLPLALPPVARSNPITLNGSADTQSMPHFVPLPQYRVQQADLKELLGLSRKASTLVGALAPITTNFRADAEGQFKVFGVKMNPDMSGPGRPGREHVNAAATLGGRLLGLDYPAFLQQVMDQAWLVERTDPLQVYSDLR